MAKLEEKMPDRDNSTPTDSMANKIIRFFDRTTMVLHTARRILFGTEDHTKTFEEEQEEAGYQKTKVISGRNNDGARWVKEIWEKKK